MENESIQRSSLTTVRVPCGLSLAHLNKAETFFAYKEIFDDRIYLRHGIELKDGDCVFDVGANIGLFTVFVQEHYRNVKTVAFEPAPEVFPLLQCNLAKYGAAAVAYPVGLAEAEREATFTYYPGYSIMSGFHASDEADRETTRAVILNQWHEKYPQQEDPEERFIDELVDGIFAGKREYRCRLRRLSDIIREQRIEEIALLKIDAEGSEMDILAGLAAEDWPRIRQIVLEVHDVHGTRGPALRQLLEEKHFDCLFDEESHFRATGIFNCYARRMA